jgi:hypothetical protein
VTLTSLASRSSAFLGPAAGGLAIAGLGTAAPFLINAATFLVLMGALVLMRNVPAQAYERSGSFRAEMLEGLSYIRRAHVLNGILRLEIVFGAFQANPVIIAIIAREILHVGPEGLGGLLSAPALGALCGLVTLLVVGHTRRPGRFIVFVQWGYSAALVLFALSSFYPLSFILLAVTGFLDVLETVTRLGIAQLAAPARMRGRVMSNMRTITGGIGPMAQTVSGGLAGAFGGPIALIISAAALATSATTSARLNRPLWDFSVDDADEHDEVLAAEGLAEAEDAVDRPGPVSPERPAPVDVAPPTRAGP